MLRAETGSLSFDRGPLVPVAAYVLTLAVLSGFALVSGGGSPPPLLGMTWGLFLAALALGAFVVEGVSPRSLLPSTRSFLAGTAVVAVFWAVYNAVTAVLALGAVPGLALSPSRVAAHPLLYLAAFGSSLLFTAIPEELVFRAYLQPKAIALAGGDTRRAAATGIVVVAVLFALFHLPRWFLLSGHGVGPDLAVRLLWLTLAGLAFGFVYALTRNLWLVALFHATMNQLPLLLSVQFPSGLHVLVGIVEYTAFAALVLLGVYVTSSDDASLRRTDTTPSAKN